MVLICAHDGEILGGCVRQAHVERVVERGLLEEGKDAPLHGEVVGDDGRGRVIAVRRDRTVHAFVVHDGQAELLEVVDALRAPRRLARGLHGG
jgi:hypothetical protein